ncbi:MAG: hypothetical protein IJ058_02085 [Lachnospiraceae bacterium]|nr:hypothetical protein [Lachnospiraceae bacterium]
MENPSDHIESRDYFSWERFFTEYLTSNTHGTQAEYSKKHLSSYYLIENNVKKIVGVIGLE